MQFSWYRHENAIINVNVTSNDQISFTIYQMLSRNVDKELYFSQNFTVLANEMHSYFF